MSIKLDSIEEGIGILLLERSVEVVQKCEIKPDELMKILSESLKE